MPQDIGPTLRVARPRTHTGIVSRSGRVKSSGVQRSLVDETEQHIELLEYEWPDLPPMRHLKDAVTRQRVSRGITYILPVDKGKNSIDSKFRTDLRAMFQEPYATEKPGYDDKKVTLSAKLHFLVNAVDTRWTRKHSEQIPVSVSSEAEKIRRLYAHSAPAGGRSKAGLSTDNLRTRSSLFLPLKSKANPESVQLRREVAEILKGVQEDNDEYEADKDIVGLQNLGESNPPERKSIFQYRLSNLPSLEHVDKTDHNPTAKGFNSYDDLKRTRPPQCIIPVQFKSEYLTPEKNQAIWEWLHFGEAMTDFQYFLTICG